MPRPPEQAQTWLTLGAASEVLGVSESTLRRWADTGEVRSYRTRGGHRRILEEDIRHILSGSSAPASSDSDRISDLAMARVRRRLSRGRQTHSMAALEQLDEAALERFRLMGRQLVDLFARYISSGTRRERFGEDARTIGHEYGRTLVGAHVGLAAAISTFNSLRHSLEETASQIATEAGLSTEEAVEAVEATLGLADVVLEGMAEVYERASAPGQAGASPDAR